jgi:hypothetical protein
MPTIVTLLAENRSSKPPGFRFDPPEVTPLFSPEISRWPTGNRAPGHWKIVEGH